MRRTLIGWLALLAVGACGEPGGGSPASGGSAGTSGPGADGSTGGAGGGTAERVVWVGAHPDDELYAAPWLGWLCVEKNASCKLLVMTRGEAGKCKLGGGCVPDLPTVRDKELEASAKLFDAELVHWDLGDGAGAHSEDVVANWSSKRGSVDALVDAIAAQISDADRVITFDPRHGSSCHADHRATGALVIAATERLGLPRAKVSLVEVALAQEPAVPQDSAVWSFDALQLLPSTDKPAWSYLIGVLQAHTSQYTPAEVAAVDALPDDKKRMLFLDLDDALVDNPHYQELCQ